MPIPFFGIGNYLAGSTVRTGEIRTAAPESLAAMDVSLDASVGENRGGAYTYTHLPSHPYVQPLFPPDFLPLQHKKTSLLVEEEDEKGNEGKPDKKKNSFVVQSIVHDKIV